MLAALPPWAFLHLPRLANCRVSTFLGLLTAGSGCQERCGHSADSRCFFLSWHFHGFCRDSSGPLAQAGADLFQGPLHGPSVCARHQLLAAWYPLKPSAPRQLSSQGPPWSMGGRTCPGTDGPVSTANPSVATTVLWLQPCGLQA